MIAYTVLQIFNKPNIKEINIPNIKDIEFTSSIDTSSNIDVSSNINFDYQLIGYRSGETDFSVILKKGQQRVCCV